MLRAMVALAAALAVPVQALAATINQNGEVLITQADALAGGVTAGDAPGYPITISQPGVYRLASSLTVSAGVNGIEVAAAEVTIDFSGHRMIGSNMALNAIKATGRSFTVRNGTIRAFLVHGVEATGSYLTVEDMRITNSELGIHHYGDGLDPVVATIRRNHLEFNNYGVRCSQYCLTQSNVVRESYFIGIGFDAVYGVSLDNSVIGAESGIAGSTFFPGDSVISETDSALDGSAYTLSPNRCDAAAC